MSISIPGADYTPQLTGYTGQGAFRFWCQKVLPIVYDDSLSYYELLNKVVNYLNNVIADVANVEDNVGRLNESYGLLQAYVNEHMQEIVDVVNEYTEFTTNYFNNLDVQEEINTKLDEMASDGSLSRLIGPIVAATAPDIIAQWLSEHITPTTPIVDKSLTVAGAAADAKIVGNQLIPLHSLTESTLTYTINHPNKAVNFENGLLNSNEEASATGYILISGIKYLRYSRCVSTAESPRSGIAFYNNEVFISGVQSVSGGDTLTYIDDYVAVPENATHVMLTVWNNTSSEFYVRAFTLGDNGLISNYGYTSLAECTQNGIYREGRDYTMTLTDLPYDYDENNAACVLFVNHPSYATFKFMTQTLQNLAGESWWRVLQWGGGVWNPREWHKLPYTDTTNTVNAIDETTRQVLPWDVGTLNVAVNPGTGGTIDNNACSITRYIDVSAFSKLQYAQCWSTADHSIHGMAFYYAKNARAYISGIYSAAKSHEIKYKQDFIDVPEGAIYARFTLWSDNVNDFYLYGYTKNLPFAGKKLSILSDSISAFTGWIPEGNQPYYDGSNSGVASVTQLWWYVLCKATGMEPLVIDAWSGSSIAYNYSILPSHSDTKKIPMCSDLRTQRLANENGKPDIIIIAGGVNDWTYAADSTTPLGTWDGHTAINEVSVKSGTSTFTESYAYLINKLQTLYPYAIIVCLSLFYTNRGSSIGVVNVNDVNNTEADYNEAIKKVCNIMGVPFIDIYNVGFTRQNMYPNFAVDSVIEATHPNSTGHYVIANKIRKNITNAISQFFGPYVPK